MAVVFVSWNSEADLERCIPSLLEHTASASLEIIVVDNASADGTVAMLRERFPSLRLIENKTNVGFARGCNQGMAASEAELILLLNCDTYVTDDVIGRCARYLLAHPETGMLGCELRFPDEHRVYTAKRSLSAWRSLVENLWLYKVWPRQRRPALLLGGYWEGGRVEADWLAGAFMMFRRELFENTGGFDPRFFMYGEDCEWGMRLRRQGYRILYAPELGVVYHVGSTSAGKAWSEAEQLSRMHQGGLEAYGMVYGRWRRPAYRLAQLFGSTVRRLAYRLANRLRPRDYFRTQADYYARLARFYSSPSTSRASRRRDFEN